MHASAHYYLLDGHFEQVVYLFTRKSDKQVTHFNLNIRCILFCVSAYRMRVCLYIHPFIIRLTAIPNKWFIYLIR